MNDEEKKAIEYLKIEYEKLMKEDNILFPLYKSDAKRLIDIIEKQSKEIEEMKKQIDLDNECEIALNSKVMDLEKEIEELKKYEKYYEEMEEVNKKFIAVDKIKEILGIEEKIDNEKLLSLLQTIIDENARLEYVEDRKVQIEYNNVFNKGVKSVEDKIKAKILECRKILYSFEKELELKANKEKYIHKESMNCLLSQISILESLLEKE